MRRILTGMAVWVCVLAVAGAVPAAQAADGAADMAAFFSTVEDLPLMPGLREAVDDAVIFDQPAGRVTEVVAYGPLSAAAVMAFYAETLPQLGWQAEAPGVYVRDGEKLTVDAATRADGTTTLRLAVSPHR